MVVIGIKKNDVIYVKESKTFYVSGSKITNGFSTKYKLLNEKTNNVMEFDLSHSDGSEWNPNTNWIYKSLSGYELRVRNDDVTPQHAENYLKAKMKN